MFVCGVIDGFLIYLSSDTMGRSFACSTSTLFDRFDPSSSKPERIRLTCPWVRRDVSADVSSVRRRSSDRSDVSRSFFQDQNILERLFVIRMHDSVG